MEIPLYYIRVIILILLYQVDCTTGFHWNRYNKNMVGTAAFRSSPKPTPLLHLANKETHTAIPDYDLTEPCKELTFEVPTE